MVRVGASSRRVGWLVAWSVVRSCDCASFAAHAETLRDTAYYLETLMSKPWPMVQGVTEWFDTGLVTDVGEDLVFVRQLLYETLRVSREDETIHMFYLGLVDGTFVGYYNERQLAVGDDFYYTVLDGSTCAWNYSVCEDPSTYCAAGYPGSNPACRSFFEAEPLTGAPVGDPWRTRLYDPRARTWYQNAAAAREAYGGVAWWSPVYVFVEEKVLGISATQGGTRASLSHRSRDAPVISLETARGVQTQERGATRSLEWRRESSS